MDTNDDKKKEYVAMRESIGNFDHKNVIII